jgi:hypothetical protein
LWPPLPNSRCISITENDMYLLRQVCNFYVETPKKVKIQYHYSYIYLPQSTQSRFKSKISRE